jgi:hypothetical protein
MGKAAVARPVKLIVSAFASTDALLQQARQRLAAAYGLVDVESDLLPFAHTSYYDAEFTDMPDTGDPPDPGGSALVRRIWSFEPLIDPGALAAIKLSTNDLERGWATNGRRRVNLDPGYVSLAKLVLATTKNHGHRVYLRDGIYAEVTLRYRDGTFSPWPWTYPDYATAAYCALFGRIRRRYVAQLHGRTEE